MLRVARIVVPGLPHHITQRGNNRQDVSFVDDDRRACLRLSTHTGRPLTTDGFLSKFERRLGRRLRPLPIGRPRQQTVDAAKATARKKQ